MFRHFIFFIILSLLFNSCRQPNNLSEEKKHEVIEEVRMMMNDYYNDIKASGLLAEFKWLDSSEDFSWKPPGYTASISYDSVANILRSNAAVFKTIMNTWATLEIQPVSVKRATYNGIITSRVTDTTGKITNTVLFEKGTVIKRKDGWKLLSGTTRILPENDQPENK